MDLSRLPPSPSSGLVHLLVVNPAGSRHLYDYCPDAGLMVLKRVLDSSIRHPFDHGFVPNTKALDGSPLAAMVIAAEPIPPGCLIRARPIGLLELHEETLCVSTLLCIPDADPRQDAIRSIRQIAPAQLEEIAEFFRTIRNVEGGSVLRQGWRDADAVPPLLKTCAEAAR